MDWKGWHKFLVEGKEIYDQSKIISFNKDQVLEARDILENINLTNNKFIIFDLETSGIVERYPQNRNKSREKEQVLQIGALALTFEKEGEDLKIINDGTLDITVTLQDNIKARLDPKSMESRRYLLHKVNTFLNDKTWKRPEGIVQIDSLNDAKNLPDDLRKKVRDFIQQHKTTADILDMTGYKESNATMDEHDALEAFLNFIKRFPNRILSGHNIINFDLKFLKQRMKEYSDLGPLEPISNVLDTLEIPQKIMHPALTALEAHFKESLDIVDKQLDEHEGQELEPLDEDEQAKQNILSGAENFINSYPEEKRELAKFKFLYTILYKKVQQTREELKNPKTGRYTSSQGPLAKLFKIDSKDWHNALADVTMLSQIYRSLYKLINFAIKYSNGALKEELIFEMEPYQQKMHDKHPKWKMKLIGKGAVKDRATPYKNKPSMQRSKSAPPGGALEEMSSMAGGAVAGYAGAFPPPKRRKTKKKQ